jgi:predicted dehydrogenase
VASASSLRAQSFAQQFAIPTHYDSYEALASDPDVDIVYVATTNHNHMTPTLLMLRHGKNVLVEKPTAVRYVEAKAMYEEAQKRGLFLMTNHWTRFFPLIKFLRRTFLMNGDNKRSARNSKDSQTKTMLKPNHRDFRLGKVMAMRGDFGFPTPLSPSDRFLNRTLGGGVTLDVGCYLIELALLAAYDHYGANDRGGETSGASTRLNPDGIEASGHGIMYNGLEFPVDVEASFSLRWGGGDYGVWNGECANGDGGDSKCETISVGGKTTKTIKSTDNDLEKENEFTMISSFQASFRRPSTFEVEYVFEYGRIVIHGPGNCPNKMTVYEHEPYGPLKRETLVSYPLPPVKDQMVKRFGMPYYPRAEGFVYVIDAIEKCMAEKGVPGREGGGVLIDGGCLELEENTIDEQLVTVQITEDVLMDMGYF